MGLILLLNKQKVFPSIMPIVTHSEIDEEKMFARSICMRILNQVFGGNLHLYEVFVYWSVTSRIGKWQKGDTWKSKANKKAVADSSLSINSFWLMFYFRWTATCWIKPIQEVNNKYLTIGILIRLSWKGLLLNIRSRCPK